MSKINPLLCHVSFNIGLYFARVWQADPSLQVPGLKIISKHTHSCYMAAHLYRFWFYGPNVLRRIQYLQTCLTQRYKVLLKKPKGSEHLKNYPVLCGIHSFSYTFKTVRLLCLPQLTPSNPVPLQRIFMSISKIHWSTRWSVSIRIPL